ncbi:hypothetical protein QQ045_006740 [Rhodiola kirilowii]
MDSSNRYKIFIYALVIMFYLFACNSADPNRNIDTKKLDKHKGTVKTYKNEFGDIFDCVDIYQQPALGHRFLINHTIQFKPTQYPKNTQCRRHSKIKKGWNITNHCPKGTIPIIRSHKYNVRNDNSYPEIAIVGTGTEDGPFYGAAAVLEVWNPKIIYPSEISLAQVMLVTNYRTPEQNSISAGWMVDEPPGYDKPPATKFFIRSTRGIGHQRAQCYNLQCAGFVQTNHEVEIGGGLQIHSGFSILINKDQSTGEWWLFMDCAPVGYWPHNIYLGQNAEVALFGGEVFNVNHDGRHPISEMGNGIHPLGRGQAASLMFLEVAERTDDGTRLTNLGNYVPYVTKPVSYDVVVTPSSSAFPGVTIQYGGPN